jgi:hypothetical protein
MKEIFPIIRIRERTSIWGVKRDSQDCGNGIPI